VTTKRIHRPRDPLALAKLIGDIGTGQVEDVKEDGKNANECRLEADPRFLRRVEKARASIRAGQGIRLEDLEPE